MHVADIIFLKASSLMLWAFLNTKLSSLMQDAYLGSSRARSFSARTYSLRAWSSCLSLLKLGCCSCWIYLSFSALSRPMICWVIWTQISDVAEAALISLVLLTLWRCCVPSDCLLLTDMFFCADSVAFTGVFGAFSSAPVSLSPRFLFSFTVIFSSSSCWASTELVLNRG